MKILYFETVKSKVIISLFESVRLSVSISPRNLYNSLKYVKENFKLCYNNEDSCVDSEQPFLCLVLQLKTKLSAKVQKDIGPCKIS